MSRFGEASFQAGTRIHDAGTQHTGFKPVIFQCLYGTYVMSHFHRQHPPNEAICDFRRTILMDW
jgi:hypothetical protein